MKERPILFSAPMVRAILDGSKTQTRRIVKLPVEPDTQWSGGWKIVHKAVTLALKSFNLMQGKAVGKDPAICPYGQPGDRLWVRETFCQFPEDARDGNGAQTYYRASQTDLQESERVMAANGVRWTPSIHMPRAASRLLLEIVSVRVERLNECSREDAAAEGICHMHETGGGDGLCILRDDNWPEQNFAILWDAINGVGAWAGNPWVWVVEFKRVTP